MAVLLTHSLPIQTFSTHWKQGVEKGCIGNEWINNYVFCDFSDIQIFRYVFTNQSDIYDEAFFAEIVNTF